MRPILLPLVSIAALAAGARADEPLRVGVVVPHEGAFALAVDGPELGTGAKAFPIDAAFHSALATQKRLGAGPLVLISGNPAPSYRIELPAGVGLDAIPIVVSVGRPSPPGLSVSSCTSTEGLHVSLWSGDGPQRVRRWSAYFYLGYDTEPTCRESELAS